MFGILDRSTVIMYVLLILSTLFVVNHDVLDRTPHKRGSRKPTVLSLYDADIYDEFYNKVYDTINVPTTQLKRCWLR
jgi:hypothetical protein